MHQLFADSSWDETDWEETNLHEVVLYLRVAKGVCIPPNFKALIDKFRFPRDLRLRDRCAGAHEG